MCRLMREAQANAAGESATVGAVVRAARIYRGTAGRLSVEEAAWTRSVVLATDALDRLEHSRIEASRQARIDAPPRLGHFKHGASGVLSADIRNTSSQEPLSIFRECLDLQLRGSYRKARGHDHVILVHFVDRRLTQAD